MMLRDGLTSLLTRSVKPGDIPTASRISSLSSSLSLSPAVNRSVLLQSMGKSGWLFSTIDRIASSVSSSEWKLQRPLSDGEMEDITTHPALDIWANPSPFYTREELGELGVQHFSLVGEIWWVILRNSRAQPVELQPVRPDHIAPVPSRDRFIAGYVHKVGTEVTPLEVEDVIFIRRTHPFDPYRGMGVVQSILLDLDIDKAASTWIRKFFDNDASPGGIVEFEEPLSDDEFDRFVMRWRTQHQGMSNVGRVAFLEKAQWKDRKITQRDMQFEQLRKLSRENVLGAFGMPGHMLGISESVNRANAEAAEVMFARWIVKPMLTRIRGALNNRLLPLFGEGLRFDFIDPTPANRAQNLEEAEKGYKASILTRNEARAKLGLGKTDDGGEEFSQPVTMSVNTTSPDIITRAAPTPVDATRPLIAAQRRMEEGWRERLGKELREILALIPESRSHSKAIDEIASHDWGWEAKYGPTVVAELASAFEAAALEMFPEMSIPLVQLRGAEWARERGATLLRLDGDQSLVKLTQQRVNDLVAGTLERGDSLRTLRSNLTSDLAFSPMRAERVARTETSFALGQGHKSAAVAQGHNEKRAFTQGDSLVRPEHSSNAAQGWIGVNESFQSGHETIPFGVNCRCNVIYRTRPPEVELSVGPEYVKGDDGSVKLLSIGVSIHCPQCKKRLPINKLQGQAEVYCKRCDKTFPVVSEGG